MTIAIKVPANQDADMFKIFASQSGHHLLVVPYSQIFDISEQDSEEISLHGLSQLHLDEIVSRFDDFAPLDEILVPSPQSISLNVSSSCNLTCSYCYAGRGSFQGAQTKTMSTEKAFAAVDRLLSKASRSAPVTIGFLGGEPLLNKQLIEEIVTYAHSAGTLLGFDVRFSVTTNGTMIDDEFITLINGHSFAVTISLDGGITNHDRERRFSNGTGSFQLISEKVKMLLQNATSAKVSARATVTRLGLDLHENFRSMLDLGFNEIGFSPLRAGVANADALQDEDWSRYLSELKLIAREEIEHLLQNGTGHIRLSNLAVALKQVHKGAASPFPCGAGGGYFSVSAQGDWYACHRAIGKPEYKLGDNDGLDENKRTLFLQSRHVHSKTDCSKCWARYLCSGGCHQESDTRTDTYCDFVRSWLEFVMATYCELSQIRPEYFQ